MLLHQAGTMDSQKITQLNYLFEKMMDEKANVEEQKQLQRLYAEYIDYGRSSVVPLTNQASI